MGRKKDPTAESKRFIGAYLSEEKIGHLFLLTLYRRTSRARMIEEFLLREIEQAPPVPALCHSLAERYTRLFHGKQWEPYIKTIIVSLDRRRIPPELIEMIVEHMNNLHGSTDAKTEPAP